MGLGLEEFYGLTPEEFEVIYRHWREEREERRREEWERARLTCLCILQPYSREALKARDVMAFPWDEAAAEREAGLGGEDEWQDIEAAKRLYGFR